MMHPVFILLLYSLPIFHFHFCALTSLAAAAAVPTAAHLLFFAGYACSLRLPLQASCNLLFTKKWLTENLVTAINGAVIGYLNDLQPNLDSYWFGILANLTLSWVVANYCMRLVSPELVAKQPAEPGGGGPAYKGGLGTLSMSPAVRGRVAADHVELQSAFERYALLLGAGVGQSLTLTLRPLKFLTEVLTLPTDVYLSFESAIVNTPATSVEIYMAFERLIGACAECSGIYRSRHSVLQSMPLLGCSPAILAPLHIQLHLLSDHPFPCPLCDLCCRPARGPEEGGQARHHGGRQAHRARARAAAGGGGRARRHVCVGVAQLPAPFMSDFWCTQPGLLA